MLSLATALCGCNFGVAPVADDDFGVADSDLAQPDLTSFVDLSQPDLAQPDLTQPDLAVTPILTYTVAAAPPAIDLTASGPHDWIHLGLVTANTVNRKASATSHLTISLPPMPMRFTNNNVSLTWTDGSPTAAQAPTTTGSYGNGVGDKFVLTAPADTTTQTLQVYVGGYAGTGRLTATLSGTSVAPIIDTSRTSATSFNAVFTITFRATTPGQLLTVQWETAVATGQGAYTVLGAAL